MDLKLSESCSVFSEGKEEEPSLCFARWTNTEVALYNSRGRISSLHSPTRWSIDNGRNYGQEVEGLFVVDIMM